MRPLLDRLARGETVLADGALGTMLFQRGLQAGECPEALNLERPELLTEVAGAYLEAGAEIIQTNTFGASPLKLALYQLDGETEAINRRAVEAVRSAVGKRAYVSGSCGPSGKLLVPYGDTEPVAMQASFRRQIVALVEAGVDLLCIETMTDLGEVSAAIRAAREVAPALPLMATMTFDPTPRGFFTIMGVTVAQAAAALAEAGADVVGSNCGNGIENMVRVAAEFRRQTELPILIQANAGLPELRDGELVYGETPEFMAERVTALIDLGVAVIGGCCGTTPEHIRAFRRVLDARD